MKIYSDDEMLMLSGIQHYRFCPRQWALIHIDQLWADNRLTVEGSILHKNVDDPFYRIKYGEKIVLRSVNLSSKYLGLYGIADLIELSPTDSDENYIHHPKFPGRWTPLIVEYKHGSPKRNEIDEVQLVAQTMCLEEMYKIRINEGSFYYDKIHQRVNITITDEHREIVKKCANEMHSFFNDCELPKSVYGKHCKNCSIKELCMPQIESECVKVKTYLINNLLK